MKIGIHKSDRSGYFSERWIDYCGQEGIPYKIVDCYGNDIMNQLSDCDALMWHISHADARDYLMAKQVIAALEASGKLVFPNYKATWHFDDKVGQKYLLEAIHAPLAPSYVFYSKREALQWARSSAYPKVFKLRGGSGSANVRLVNNYNEAARLINRAFGKGLRPFDRRAMLKDAFKKTVAGKLTVLELTKSVGKLFVKSHFEKVKGSEAGYVYFQEFYPGNEFDIRVIVVGNSRAFAIKRMTRANDFRASGSGMIVYDREQIDPRCVRISFDMTDRIGANCLCFDFVFDSKNSPVILEISFGFMQAGYDDCQGYWDRSLNWHAGRFLQQGWMVEDLVAKLKRG